MAEICAVLSRARVATISRPQVPSPITAQLIWKGTRVSKSAARAGAWERISTPPSSVIKVANELPFRNSRRLRSGDNSALFMRFQLLTLPPKPATISEGSSCLLQFFDADVAERDGTMIALQENRAGFIHLVVNLAPGGPIADDVVVDFLAIQNHRDLVANDGRFHRVPFAGRLRHKFGRSGMVVDRAVSAQRRFAALVVVKHLNFMPPSKVKAAVGTFRDFIFIADSEVPEILLRDKVSAVLVFVHRVD